MTIFKKTLVAFFMAGVFVSSASYAEEATKPAVTQENAAATVLTHLEQASETAGKSDFQNAMIHLKAARYAAGEMTAHQLDVHRGVAEINNGIKASKIGEPEQATKAIQKAIAIFKAL